MALAEWQELIVERLHNGGSLSDVEAEIIDRSPWREQKAALWLYAHGRLSGGPRGPERGMVRALALERG